MSQIPSVTIKPINWKETLPLRHKVLWPDKPVGFCLVDGDESAWHLGAYLDETMVGVASVFALGEQARLRKFAVDPEHQNKGIGSQMLTFIINALRQQGTVSTFWCDARESASAVYQRVGMKKYGERFFKGDIPYFKMSMSIK
ncbi:GNAT family N-acetyltransferase [Veronia pacifica]|uniref:GNAT family acetyltransferase n=1 Tax=Veronia pacifica TaxID=1080227 RepID=A0A1C3EAN5_9GAMM|nr:GNAT family N-acetyltransferase [Veronia pacifica]ODA30293.1 GNAT family acetyltransferase [Veronia pacifica]